MKARVLFLVMVVLASAAIAEAGTEQKKTGSKPAPLAKFEGGALYKAGKFDVLELHGSYHQMGRQYGHLFKDDLKKFYQLAVIDTFIKEQKLDYESAQKTSTEMFKRYPERIKKIFYGMAETSGMEMDKLLILNQLVVLSMLVGAEAHCSYIATWGDYSVDRMMVAGRHWDYPEFYKKFSNYLTLVIFNPIDGSVPIATIGFPGMIETYTSMNRAGLFAEINDGQYSGGAIAYENRTSVTTLPLFLLLDFSNIDQLDVALNSIRGNYPILLNVTDKNRSYSYEIATFDVKRKEEDKQGLLVSTNHFNHPSWGIVGPTGDPHQTVSRRTNLLALGEKYKGRFNPQVMMEVLDIPWKKGGAMRSRNIYEVIYTPKDLVLWLKTPGFSDWEKIDLKQHFSVE